MIVIFPGWLLVGAPAGSFGFPAGSWGRPRHHIQECQNLDKNHEIWSESGPYGPVWADIQPEWILQGLGSLWDAPRALKPPGKITNLVFRGLGEIPLISPYEPYPLQGSR